MRIFEAGEPVLRQMSREVPKNEITTPAVQELIEAMFAAMRAAPGVGLAAPQLGLDLRIAVIEDRQEYIDKIPAEQAQTRLRSAVPPHAIINPVLHRDGAAEVEHFEGCLSLPGFTAIVPRALAVRVECLNERAEPVVINASGWYARILQHEIDHLDGKLYIDRMLTSTFMGRENFERLWKNVPIDECRSRLVKSVRDA